MNGALLAAASGVGFGLFQTTNARAVRAAEDPFASTLVQIGVATFALVVLSLATGELADALDAPLWALGDFALAGLLHFLVGWSLLNLSQQRIGAARTSPLLTTVPVFGIVIAAVTIGQLPGPTAIGAIALMCAGAYLVAMRGGMKSPRVADALRGLEGFDSPVAGLTVGLIVSVAVFAPLYALWRGRTRAWIALKGSVGKLKLIAGVL